MRTLVCFVLQLMMFALLFSQCDQTNRAVDFESDTYKERVKFDYTVQAGENLTEILTRETSDYTRANADLVGLDLFAPRPDWVNNPVARYKGEQRHPTRRKYTYGDNTVKPGDVLVLCKVVEIDSTPSDEGSFYFGCLMILFCLSLIIKPEFWKWNIVFLAIIMILSAFNYFLVTIV